MPTSSASSGSDSPAQPSGPETRPATPEPGEPTNNKNATSSAQAGVPESGTNEACCLDYQAVELGLERYLKDNNTGTIDEGADLIDIGG
ncbi:hypothetical protein EVJ58_g9056, partial [Rhodofomes roseus]